MIDHPTTYTTLGGVEVRELGKRAPWHRWSTWSVIEVHDVIRSEWEVGRHCFKWWSELVTEHAVSPHTPLGMRQHTVHRRNA